MKYILIIAAMMASVYAIDFKHMDTEKMMSMRGSVPTEQQADFRKEMQKRMQAMSPEEHEKYFGNSNNKMMNQDKKMNQGMNQNKGMMTKEGKSMNQGKGMMNQGQGMMSQDQGMMKNKSKDMNQGKGMMNKPVK